MRVAAVENARNRQFLAVHNSAIEVVSPHYRGIGNLALHQFHLRRKRTETFNLKLYTHIIKSWSLERRQDNPFITLACKSSIKFQLAGKTQQSVGTLLYLEITQRNAVASCRGKTHGNTIDSTVSFHGEQCFPTLPFVTD